MKLLLPLLLAASLIAGDKKPEQLKPPTPKQSRPYDYDNRNKKIAQEQEEEQEEKKAPKKDKKKKKKGQDE